MRNRYILATAICCLSMILMTLIYGMDMEVYAATGKEYVEVGRCIDITKEGSYNQNEYYFSVSKNGSISFDYDAIGSDYYCYIKVYSANAKTSSISQGEYYGQIFVDSSSNINNITPNSCRLKPGEYKFVIAVMRKGINRINLVYNEEDESSYESEDNNSFDSANYVDVGKIYSASVAAYYDKEDYFKVELSDPGALYVSVTSELPNIEVEVFKADSNLNNYSIMSGFVNKGEEYFTQRKRVNSGVYYIVFRYNGSGACLNYKFSIRYEKGDANSEVEGNGSINQANILETGKTKKGNIDSSSDVDYYKISVKDVGKLNFVISTPGQTSENQFKYEIINLDNLGKEHVLEEYYSTENPTVVTENMIVYPGDYYLRVSRGTSTYDSFVDYSINTKYEKIILIKSLKLSGDVKKLFPGSVVEVKTTIKPTNASIKKLVWTSSNDDVAVVNDDGIVFCDQPGEVDIIAATSDTSEIVGILHIVVNEPANPSLKAIKISCGTMDKMISPDETSYTITLPNNKNKVKITPIKRDSRSKVKINGKKRKSITVSLANKKSQTIKIEVTAADGSKLIYKIKVEKTSNKINSKVEKIVENIRGKYTNIRNTISSLNKVKSSSHITDYYSMDMSELVMAVVTQGTYLVDGYNDTYKAEYYYDNNSLIFVYVYDDVEEHRFYIKDNKCIRYIDEEGKISDYANGKSTSEIEDITYVGYYVGMGISELHWALYA